MKKENITVAYVIGIAVVALTFVIASFYNMILIPKQELQHKIDKEQTLKRDYDLCVDLSFQVYKDDFELNCQNQGLEDDCALPRSISDGLESLYMDRKDSCLKVYEAFN